MLGDVTLWVIIVITKTIKVAFATKKQEILKNAVSTFLVVIEPIKIVVN